MTVLGVTIAVPTTSDLILLKLAAGGHLDLHEAAALLALRIGRVNRRCRGSSLHRLPQVVVPVTDSLGHAVRS